MEEQIYTVGEFQTNQHTTEAMVAADQSAATWEEAIAKAKALHDGFEFGEIVVGVWGGDSDELLALVIDSKVFTIEESF